MSKNFKFHPQAAKDLYKLAKKDKPLGKIILDTHIPRILSNPFQTGRKKHGMLSCVRGYEFAFQGKSYRILYTVHKDIVRFIAFGIHDIAYRKAEGRA